MIGLAAPFLDLVLGAGERISRIVGPADDYIPIRPPSDAFELGFADRPPARDQPARELSD